MMMVMMMMMMMMMLFGWEVNRRPGGSNMTPTAGLTGSRPGSAPNPMLEYRTREALIC